MSHAISFSGYQEPVRLPDKAARRSLFPPKLTPVVVAPDPGWSVPGREDCRALWDKYAMPEHIRAHSAMVANFAFEIARLAKKAGADVHLPSVLAAGMLHDLGKMYSVTHGGSHAQLGGAWVRNETRNPYLAQGVIQHVRWIWDIDETVDPWLLAFCIIYADKRVMHDAVVTPEERYTDLLERYGHTADARARIALAHRQGLDIEAALSRRIGVPLHEHTFDSGRLVKRA